MLPLLSLGAIAWASSSSLTTDKQTNPPDRGASQGPIYLRPLAFDQPQSYEIVGQTQGRNKRIRTRVNAEKNGLQPKQKATPYGKVSGPVYDEKYIQPQTWQTIHENTRNSFIEEGLGEGLRRAWLNPMPATVRVARSKPWMQPGISVVATPSGDNNILSPYVHDVTLGKFSNPKQILSQGFVSFTDRTYNVGPSRPAPNHFTGDKTLRPIPRTIEVNTDTQKIRERIISNEKGLGALMDQRKVLVPGTLEHQYSSMLTRNVNEGSSNSAAWDLALRNPIVANERQPYQ